MISAENVNGFESSLVMVWFDFNNWVICQTNAERQTD